MKFTQNQRKTLIQLSNNLVPLSINQTLKTIDMKNFLHELKLWLIALSPNWISLLGIIISTIALFITLTKSH